MEIVYTDWAEKCLKEIFEHYSKKTSIEKALQIVEEIIKSTERLQRFPEQGQIEIDLKILGQNHRYILKYHYKIIYKIERDKVYVTDIFSTWQEPEKKRERNE